MISFVCPGCAGSFEVAEELAGKVTTCSAYGATTMVPIDLACDGDAAPPEAQTLPLAELEAMRKGLALKPKP
jgi:hypothetical protein